MGRQPELAHLSGLLSDLPGRLLTLTGPPGVGKTRLALAAAAAVRLRFRDGASFVDLAPVRQVELVSGELARVVSGGGATLASRLPPAHMLLVVDNFEHVLAAADAIAQILLSCSGVTLLVTSRERLHLRSEHEVPVAPLLLPGPAESADLQLMARSPAVELLVERVRAFDPAFAVTAENADVLAEICVRLDGLPLALELAAPQLRVFSPRELLVRLRRRTGSLASDARDVPDRHRTLFAALSWSRELLDDEEQATFRRLSVFAGSWTLTAAEPICAVRDVVGATSSLLSKGLIYRVDGAGDAARFGMLEGLREFAADMLDAAGETSATKDRHAEYVASAAAALQARIGTPDERATVAEVGLDVGNLRAALRHCLARGQTAGALPLATALGWYSYTRGQVGAGQATVDAALAAAARAGGLPVPHIAELRQAAGVLAYARGQLDHAEELIARSIAEGPAESLRHRAIGNAFLGHIERARGRTQAAATYYRRAGALHQRAGNPAGLAWSHYDLGLLARRAKDTEQAAGLLREALVAFARLQYPWAIGCAACALATVHLGRGRANEAAPLLAEALARFESTDDLRGVAQCLEGAASVACEQERALEAARLLGAAAHLRGHLGSPLPPEEQGACGAVERRLRRALGPDALADAEQAGRAAPTAAMLALAREMLTAGPGHRSASTLARVGPASAAGLTKREREVARLVRDGRTNRQIGRALGIAEKTAEVHVHNILRKLDVSSRAEVAAWVVAHDREPLEGGTPT